MSKEQESLQCTEKTTTQIGIETISTEKLLVNITNNDEEKQATHWIKY